MSGSNENHCRIGKVTLKNPAEVIKMEELPKRAPGRVRSLFVEAIAAIDHNAAQGVHPVVGFFAMVDGNGVVDITYRMNKEATEEELAKLNWRHLAMLFEDMAQDCRNYGVYHQRTAYDLLNEIPPEPISEED